MIRRIALVVLALVAVAPPAGARPPRQAVPATILVSIDGFRPDYLSRGATPNLDALARTGVSAAMRPVFPSKTFPNHWTMVTGLLPDHHGIVANRMVDFNDGHPAFVLSSEDPWWWQSGDPVWLAASRAGIRSATEFWPGSTVAGRRADDANRFDPAVPPEARVDVVLDWLRRPPATRPGFIALYFEAVDSAGHAYGPDSAEVTQAVAKIDAAIGRLRSGLAALHRPANIVIVSDHGMAALSPARVVDLSSFASPADFDLIEEGPYASLNAVPGHEAALAAALARAPAQVQCWPKGQIPARLRYGASPRIPQFLCLAEPGWQVLGHLPASPLRGNHGYDNDAPEMRALFIAAGPAFRRGRHLPVFDNLTIEPLLRDLLGLPPGQDRDGDDRPLRPALTRRALIRR
jgi:predicted AlkP superfamily pyrophosphatase or phosphodiesterase